LSEQRPNASAGVTIAHVSPPVSEAMPKSMNVHLTFEEALKPHFGAGEIDERVPALYGL
jgi:hypothetical protein